MGRNSNEPRGIQPVQKRFKNQLRTNGCTMDGCRNHADQTSLVTFEFDKEDVGKNHKTYLATCTPCVERSVHHRTFSAHVAWEEGSSSGVREVPIINEAYQPDVHDVSRGPATPEPEVMHTSRVPF